MEKKSKKKKLKLKHRIEIVAKSPYVGSGPRGVDVYATHLFNSLSSTFSRDKTILSRDKPKAKKTDLVHFTFFDPFFLTLWKNRPKQPYIVTVHDLIPLKFPSHFPVGIRGKLRWLLQKRALLSASAIITDSECSKVDIAELTGIKRDKIFVVPLAAGHTTLSKQLVKQVIDEYSLPERFILYVGDINWNKNIPGLIKAFAGLSSKNTRLILVGKAFESSRHTPEYQAIKQAIDESGKSDLIHMLGFVPSHHLPSIYRAATLYVQPSWYEGFGFPVLEALEQGTPVASANTGSLPEVGGEYVHYFDPSNLSEMTKLIQSLLDKEDKRTKFVDEGKIWASRFTWDKVIESTHAVYEHVLG